MSQPYVGEIRLFAGNFAPDGWMLCQGQLLDIATYETLFQLIGTSYGGDGQSTFGLPDLGGRFAVGSGQGPGLPNVAPAETGGVETVTLTTSQIPQHGHAVAAAGSATTASAAGAFPAGWADVPYSSTVPSTPLAAQQVGSAGGSQPHENRQPYLTLNAIISLYGVFPSQT